jgi:hypothetical protein
MDKVLQQATNIKACIARSSRKTLAEFQVKDTTTEESSACCPSYSRCMGLWDHAGIAVSRLLVRMRRQGSSGKKA